MKLVIMLHYQHAICADIAKISDPTKYKLYGVFNAVPYKVLTDKKQEHYFEETLVTEDFSFENLKQFIDKVRDENNDITEIAITAGTEGPMIVCGRLNKHYGLTTENYDRFIDKIVMKDILKQSDVALPAYMKFDKTEYKNDRRAYLEKIIANISFPMFAKPIDQNSSFGTKKIDNAQELADWAGSVHEDKYEYEVDSFIEGTLYHCDSFIKDGKILYTQVSRDLNPCYDFICGKPEGSIVLEENDPLHARLRAFTANALEKLGMPEKGGVTHMEVFMKPNGQIVFLEVGYRPGGAVIPRMYEIYLKRDIRADHVLLQLDPNYQINIEYGPYGAWVSYPLQQGFVTECNSPTLTSPKTDKWNVTVGQTVDHSAKVLANEAYQVLFSNHSFAALEQDFVELGRFRAVTVNPLETKVKRTLSFTGDYKTATSSTTSSHVSGDANFTQNNNNNGESSGSTSNTVPNAGLGQPIRKSSKDDTHTIAVGNDVDNVVKKFASTF